MPITLARAERHIGRRVIYSSVASGKPAETGVITGLGPRGLVLVDYGDGAIHPTHPDNLTLISKEREPE